MIFLIGPTIYLEKPWMIFRMQSILLHFGWVALKNYHCVVFLRMNTLDLSKQDIPNLNCIVSGLIQVGKLRPVLLYCSYGIAFEGILYNINHTKYIVHCI